MTGRPSRAADLHDRPFPGVEQAGGPVRPTLPANCPARASKWSEVSQTRDRSGWMFTKIRKRRSPCEGRVGNESKCKQVVARMQGNLRPCSSIGRKLA